mgnify:CR=1 FL=1
MHYYRNLLFILFITVFACNIHAVSSVEKKLVENNKELKIALVLWRGETKSEVSFMKKLKNLGYKIKYTVYNAQNQRYKFPDVLRMVNFKEYDYVYTFGTTASQMCKRLIDNKVPQIFNIVSAPVMANVVDSMGNSGGNISGVSNQVPLELQIQTALSVFKFTRLALFFNPREQNSMIIRSKLIHLGQKYNFEVVSLRSPIKDMLNENLKKLSNGTIDVDAVYLPADSFIVSNAKLIGQTLRDAKIKSIGAIKEYVEKGALIGTVTDYVKLGEMAANILDKHQRGTPLNRIPVQIQKKPILVLNKTTRDLLDIDINKKIIKSAVLIK